jgi:hypothetical protein
MQAVNIELPDEIYRRLHGMAAATHRSLEDILVQTLRGNLPPTLDDLPAGERDLVVELTQLDDDGLWALAKEPLPAAEWRRHQRLLRKAEAATLTAAERAAVADLRAVTDRFVLRRSVALALLKWRGHAIPVTL